MVSSLRLQGTFRTLQGIPIGLQVLLQYSHHVFSALGPLIDIGS